MNREKRMELRKRAAQQAVTGNYWAGKCVAVLDAYDAAERHWDDLCDKQLDAEGELRLRINELKAELRKQLYDPDLLRVDL